MSSSPKGIIFQKDDLFDLKSGNHGNSHYNSATSCAEVIWAGQINCMAPKQVGVT